MKHASRALALVAALALVIGCRKDKNLAQPIPASSARAAAPAPRAQLDWDGLPRGTPYVPPQCYTKTRDEQGQVHNPCFTCHVNTPPPNYILDGDLQLAYDFSPPAAQNRWTNLFVDRRPMIRATSDEAVLAYVRRDNLAALAERLAAPPRDWDRDGDGRWSGYVPDVGYHFDADGFDHDAQGNETGFRAYSYFPLPGGFWPTNGSFGDALIRLPEAFRRDESDRPSRAVYIANLAILEALIARRDVTIAPVDERELGADIDGDGKLGPARRVRYRWRAGGGGMTYAGRAAELQRQGKVQLAAGLFPEGTELVHSLRYLDVKDDKVVPAARLKELRYMKKAAFMSFGALEAQALREAAEKEASPDKRRLMRGSAERGIGNGAGWRLQGFIEDESGELRPQTLGEHAFCIGCHSGIGATDDSVFSFGRKLGSEQRARGWFHSSQAGLDGIGEPQRADGRGEYSHYLDLNGAGDELRANGELIARFFDAQGRLIPEKAHELSRDVTSLLLPSPERALLLDKAYLAIVREQSFDRGRDATPEPAQNVLERKPNEPQQATGVEQPITERRAAASALALRNR